MARGTLSGIPAVIHASAPVRLDFAGAWTDVAPFASEQRGVVVNAAIDLRTRVTLRTGFGHYALRADDLNQGVDAATIEELAADGTLGLLKAAIRRSGIGPCLLRTAAAAPAGSGLGTSGALAVALSSAISRAQGRSLTATEIAHEAWLLETVDAAVPGGQQDQYAAALGGFQRLVFDHGVATASTLDIDAGFAEELAAHTVICYTGASRFSGGTIAQVMRAYARGDAQVSSALHALADIAEEMAAAMQTADMARVGSLVARNWTQQQQLAPGMCTPEMAALEAAMLAAGAIGGKAAGAGAGGSMFFVVPTNVAAAVAAARATGAVVLATQWADHGVTIN